MEKLDICMVKQKFFVLSKNESQYFEFNRFCYVDEKKCNQRIE